ncbi:MAG: HEAT repeat domain-containing protein [Calditrichaceae bacterium]
MAITNKNKRNVNIEIKDNILKLADRDGVERERARKKLVEIGTPAIDFLSEMETHPKAIARWEAVKTLSEIKDPISAPLLINALEDKSTGVRWLAAEGLAALGKKGMIAVLKALVDYPETVYLRQGAHHVLKRLQDYFDDENFRQILKTLEYSDAADTLPSLIITYLDKIGYNVKSNVLS